MVNLSKTLLQDLINAGYARYTLFNSKDVYNDNVSEADADEITIIRENPYFSMDSFRIPKKKEVNINYIIANLEKDNIYRNFTENFKQLLEDEGVTKSLNVYPTTYGIGVSIVHNYKGCADKLRLTIESILDKKEVSYRTEVSEGMWVMRYIISKAKTNLDKLK